ncbi:hypothetical protein QVD17_20453 [Tagetes erecta]|uniref:Uncharacterized protein n=1 Tax=Tagetes erecta TaxID=13708 RepID=A0AAD8KP61_TARER|nr:hypothetical protein QVD17_20453 [Tagetes erecta]
MADQKVEDDVVEVDTSDDDDDDIITMEQRDYDWATTSCFSITLGYDGNVEELVFGQDMNKHEYFPIKEPLDVYEDESLFELAGDDDNDDDDYGGGGFYEDSVKRLSVESSSVVVVASEKSNDGEEIRVTSPVPWWKKCWLKFTCRSMT